MNNLYTLVNSYISTIDNYRILEIQVDIWQDVNAAIDDLLSKHSNWELDSVFHFDDKKWFIKFKENSAND